VVWFGETLPEGAFEKAAEWAAACDVFLVIGTSAVVYPAAGLAQVAFDAGATVIEVNPEPTPAARYAAIALAGKSGEILPKLVG
jgi:NAD-dependent deacetylase